MSEREREENEQIPFNGDGLIRETDPIQLKQQLLEAVVEGVMR